MAGGKKGPWSSVPSPFLALTLPQEVNAVPLTPSPDFRVLCGCHSSKMTPFRLFLQKEDWLRRLFLFLSIVRLGRWVVANLEFQSKASFMFGNHSAFEIRGAYWGRLS